MTKRDAALALAQKGFRVFRLPANAKYPPPKAFYDVATSDQKVVSEWFTEAVGDGSTDHNIGISTDDLVVLDFDGEQGMTDLSMLEMMGLDTSYIVSTPNGGLHVLAILSDGSLGRGKTGLDRVSGSIKKIGKGTDVKSHHGYVLGPGSTIDGRPYQWRSEPRHRDDLPVAADWLVALCGKPVDRPDGAAGPDIDLDSESAIARGIRYLEDAAPEAIEGEGGEFTTLKVAMVLRDFGVSESSALELLLDHWSEHRASPPWPPDMLEQKVANAYRYAKGEAGSISADAEFEPYVTPRAAAEWPAPTILDPFENDELEPRRWIVDGMLARGFVTALVAPSGAGKTQWLSQLILGISAGQGTPAGVTVHESVPIWSWNQEDDREELKRRIAAARSHYKLDWPSLRQAIYLDSGVEKALLVARRDKNGSLRRTPEVDKIVQYVISHGIGVLVADPTIEFHEANENDNVEMRFVMACFRYIATKANCAVLIVHHSKKPDGASSDGFAGNADSARGASALQGVTRVMLTLYGMSQKDAKAFGVPDDDRGSFVRLDGAKSNISAAGRGLKPLWFRWQSVQLAFEGDNVGVLESIDLTRAKRRVEKSIDAFEAVARVMVRRGENQCRWAVMFDSFAIETGWAGKTCERWMADQPPGVYATTEGKLVLYKKKGKDGCGFNLNVANGSYVANFSDGDIGIETDAESTT